MSNSNGVQQHGTAMKHGNPPLVLVLLLHLWKTACGLQKGLCCPCCTSIFLKHLILLVFLLYLFSMCILLLTSAPVLFSPW